MPTRTLAPALVGAKRLNFLVSERVHAELLSISRASHRSMTDIIRLGIALAKIALDATAQGNKLVIAGPDGTALKELVLPE